MSTILYVSSQERIGGAEHCLLALLRHLDQERFQALVCCPGPSEFTDELEQYGLKWDKIAVGRMRYPWRLLGTVLALSSIATSEGAALIHANDVRAHMYASMAARLTKLPLLWHLRDQPGDWPLWTLRAALAFPPTSVVAITEAVRDELRAMGGVRLDFSVIHDGLETDRFLRAANGDGFRKDLGIRDSQRLAGIVGRLVPGKGHRLFLEAAAEVARQLPETRFVVVGDVVADRVISGQLSGYRRELEDLANTLGLRERVVFTGQRRDVARIMSSLDLLVLASEREGAGAVLVEAMACGKPVVATRVGGVPELVLDGKTGLLVEPGEVDGMAAAMTQLLANPRKARQMGEEGRARVHLFDIGLHVAKVQELYEEILARKPIARMVVAKEV